MSQGNELELPKGWVSAGLSEIAGIVMGQSPPSSTYNLEGEGLPFFQGKAEFGSLYPEARVWCTAPGKLAEKDDILLSVRAPVGPTNLAPSKSCIGRGLSAIHPESGINLKYLLHALRRFALELDAKGTGTTFKAVSGKVVREFPIPVAPSSEQERIADALDELLSDLDAGVAALERVQAKLKSYRAAVLKAAVEGSLTADWRALHPANEPASAFLTHILAERRRRWEATQLKKFKDAGKAPPKNWKEKYKEPTAPDTASLPALPEVWHWVRLEELLFEIEAGKSFTCLPRQADPSEWGIVKVSAMSWGSFDESENKAVPANREIDPYYEIKDGDILLSRANTFELVGASVLVKSCRPRLLMSDKSMRLLHGPSVDKVWLQTMLGSPWVRRQLSRKSTGTKEGMRNVSQESVLDVVIPLAPADECLELVERAEDQLSVIEHLEADLDAKLKSAHALRQSIFRHAFTGQLVPQDPEDEPAAELLKRLTAERQESARQSLAANKAKKTSKKKVKKNRRKKESQ